MSRPSASEGGQVTVMVLGLAIVTFAVAGLAIDGTRVFLARRTLQNAADASALAAASEIDRPALYRSAGSGVVLDAGAARRVAAEWLDRRGLAMRASISADESTVAVTLRSEVPTTVLGVVGVSTIGVAARAEAQPLVIGVSP
jgi:uncharacterized membrane protein